MNKLITLLGLLLIGSFASAGITLGEKFLLPNVLYVNSGATVATGAGGLLQGKTVVSRTNTGVANFYLNSFTIEGFFNVVSASATRLGYCSLQIPAGTTVATYNFVNPTGSQVDRVVITPQSPIVVSSSFAVQCANSTTTTTNWGVTYNGWEY